MRRKLKLSFLNIFAFFIWSFFFSQNAYGANVNNFSIQTLDTDGNTNQQGYYHLFGDPGERQDIHVKIHNASDEEITVKAYVNPASTNNNGIPSYLGEKEYDTSLIYRMDKLVTLEKNEVTIPALESVTIKAEISFPDEEWKGDILGGIRFTEKLELESDQTVIHEVAYTVGILLNQQNGDAVENNLNLKEIFMGQRNYRNYVEINIQNSTASIIRDMSINSKVFKYDNDKAIYTNDAHELRMVPNSNFNFGIPTGDKPLVPGDYILEMVINADEKEYSFEKEFTINATEASKLNQSAVNLDVESSYIWYLLIGLVGVIIVFLVLRLSIKKQTK